jgi:dTDP-N-acetylfucosamine:lipid II N-acetylfucosaminyltransferase
MHRHSYIHLCPVDKFMPPFVAFVEEHFGLESHLFLVNGLNDPNFFGHRPCVKPFGRWKHLIPALWHLNRARIIILHSLFSVKVTLLLLLQPWLLPRCRWVIWGGDLYMHDDLQKSWQGRCWDAIRRQVIRRIGGLITYIEGDVQLAHKWYGANGRWQECLMYPSNLYREPAAKSTMHEEINILVGNSATVSNNHKDALNKLAPYADKNIKIYCPLSYGDKTYAQDITAFGNSLFEDKFIALREFMALDDYTQLLAKIDIAVFNHNRQQGMGNTISLLGMGKKIYMRDDVTPYPMLKKLGIMIYSFNNFDLKKIDESSSAKNSKIIREHFSEQRLTQQWTNIYG